MYWWNVLSLAGSVAVTGPLGVVITAYLLISKQWRLTATWLLLFGGGMALVVLTKMAFVGWGIGVASVQFAGISGHAMRSAVVYPVAGYLIFRSLGPLPRQLGAVAGTLLAIMISISRIPVQAHSVSESVTGTLLGLGVAGAFIWYASRQAIPAQPFAAGRVLAVLCAAVAVLGPRMGVVPAEAWIAEAALRVSGHERAYPRASGRNPLGPQLGNPASVRAESR